MAMEWIDELRHALGRQYGRQGAPVAALATVDRSGAPHVRAIVCRRLDDEGLMYFVSDARSEKNNHVRGEARAELVFWLPEIQTQFRALGEMRIISMGQDEILRRELWQALDDRARALFFWPTPGVALAADDDFAQGVAADVSPPKTFEVLMLKPLQVERLNLTSFPYRRRRWRADANWNGVDVNP